MKNSEYHIPVLLHAATDALVLNPNGVYVDVTFGGGGHSRSILDKLDKGRLIAFDQDIDAANNVIEDPRFLLAQQNFRHLQNVLNFHGIDQVDGVLADLGVSSHQFNEGERGFSFRNDGKLDMRMNQNSELSAFHVVNNYDEIDLNNLFVQFGEFNKGQASSITNKILSLREEGKLESTQKLAYSVGGLSPFKGRNKFLARVFQALRIEVNQEMQALLEMLEQIPACLKPDGRLVVITYHSLEDRMAKNFIRSGNFKGELDKDFFGNVNRPLEEVVRKPIVPSESEVRENSRARSAKLRIASKKSKK
ncbi:MAG: 16S rRNA (cytosine(1402)-N(4))-methyltransferase RsmH [Flavobacteriales bacterium]|nr:16S rRNA (cytosine(1402)-N(4))-methyltransferase RsmH [Flavobacteriales bacterium]